MEFIKKLVSMGYPEEYAEQVYLLYMELDSKGSLKTLEERAKDKELFD